MAALSSCLKSLFMKHQTKAVEQQCKVHIDEALRICFFAERAVGADLVENTKSDLMAKLECEAGIYIIPTKREITLPLRG